MSLENYYLTLDYDSLDLIAHSKGLNVSPIHSKQEIINVLLFIDKEAAIKSRHYEKLYGKNLIICHGRVHAHLLNVNYDLATFVDYDPSSLPDVNADYSQLKFNDYFDNIILVHCPIPEDFNFLYYLKKGGYFYMTLYSNTESYIQKIKNQYNLNYIGIETLDIYLANGINEKKFLTFKHKTSANSCSQQ